MSSFKTFALWLSALSYIGTGAAHFLAYDFFMSIMPPWIPWHSACVIASGVVEIIGGVGLLIPGTRLFARWWLLGLLVVVYPVNLHMAFTHTCPPAIPDCSLGGLWVRASFQFVFAAWLWWVTVPEHGKGETA
jgi:uncharacterized membrane protein